MKITLLSFLFLFSVSHLFGQDDPTNPKLSKLLDSLYNADQSWHQLYLQVQSGQKDTLSKGYIMKQSMETDSLNFPAIKSIFDKYGYPNYDLVGDSSEHHFWLLVQHADKHPEFQQQVLDSMKAQVQKQNASAMDYAYLVDRIAINAKQLQVYGTQVTFNKDKQAFEPQPVSDSANLDKRREEVGLPPIERFLKRLNDRYHGIKVEDDTVDVKDDHKMDLDKKP